MPASHDAPGLIPDALALLEATVGEGLRSGEMTGLDVIGFGELSIALGLDLDGEKFVAKRMSAFTPAEFANYSNTTTTYLEQLNDRGVQVVPTSVHHVQREDGSLVGYLVQPRLAGDSIGGQVLRNASPSENEPLLQAIGAIVLSAVDDRVSIDSQVTNWSIDGSTIQLLDVGTPLMWSDDGSPVLDMTPLLRSVPAPVRWPVRTTMVSLMNRWKEPQGVLLDALANLLREGLDEWMEPAAACWSAQLGVPLDLDSARKTFAEDKRIWPLAKKLQQAERSWRRRRGDRYDFFIQSTIGEARIL